MTTGPTSDRVTVFRAPVYVRATFVLLNYQFLRILILIG